MKRIFFITLLALGSTQSAFAMDVPAKLPQKILNQQLIDVFRTTKFRDRDNAADAQAITKLLETGANPNVSDDEEDCKSPLHEAVNRNNIAACEALIKHKANLEAVDKNNSATPLFYAAEKGYEQICKLLIQYGANIRTKSRHGFTPLMNAAVIHHGAVCSLLIKNGANINDQSSIGYTALLLASRCEAMWNRQKVDNPTVCKLLLDHGANITLQDEEGNTALANAGRKGFTQICRTLITYPTFNPYKTEKELEAAQEKIFTALCMFHRLCPTLPKDIRALILMRDPSLREDFCCTATGLLRNNLHRIYSMPIQTIRLLLQSGHLNPKSAISTLKEHHCKCIIPLMEKARKRAKTDKMKEFLNPENLESNFGDGIKQNIERRLHLPETNEADTNAVSVLQSENNEIDKDSK
jgi:hypothetical protein